MAVMMKSVVEMYITEVYNPKYYIYQALLYCLGGFVVIKNRKTIQVGGYIRLIWAFSILCFLFSFIRLDSFNARSIIALFFNSFIILLAYLNGIWFGDRLSSLKDRDWYLLLLLIPALYSMYLLRSYNSLGNWFDADAAFSVIVFFPFVFFFKRNWLSVLLALLFVVFSLIAAKRSILIFVIVCIAFYSIYRIFLNRKKRNSNLISRLLILMIIIFGSYYILTNESSGLMHTQERTERLGGITFDNGRYDIYSKVSSAILNAEAIPFLFGHGHAAVKRDFGIGAHNDFLEIGYDYGIIVALIYICIILYFFTKALRLIKQKEYQSAMWLGISISSIFILGMLNCIITSSVLEYTMFLALGCALGMNERPNPNDQG